MRCLDLITGIGGMGRLLPFHPVMFCEIEPFPRSVLERRNKSGDLPPVPIHDDVRTLQPPDHDILIGGFPCQDISTLGLKKGLEGKKSSLYFQILRIIKLKHPKYVFLENVAHILQMPEAWQYEIVPPVYPSVNLFAVPVYIMNFFVWDWAHTWKYTDKVWKSMDILYPLANIAGAYIAVKC